VGLTPHDKPPLKIQIKGRHGTGSLVSMETESGGVLPEPRDTGATKARTDPTASGESTALPTP
jgi:hypothetical protein